MLASITGPWPAGWSNLGVVLRSMRGGGMSSRVPRVRVRVPRGTRCRYYVNTNFFVDLEEDRPEAIAFARRRSGLCTSTILLWEYREEGLGWLARRLARQHEIRIIWVPVLRIARLVKERVAPRAGWNTRLDYAHILVALNTPGVQMFVTSDQDTCRRALRLGLYCMNHRTGEERAPSSS